jgi:hypothetical protein
MNRALLTILLTFAGIYFAKAQSAVEERYLGSWMFMEVHHDIANRAYLTVYMENDVYQFRSLNCRYARFSAGYNFLPWLKTGVNYVPVSEPDRWRHYLEGDLMGILKSGDFKVSLRERYRYRLTGEGTHELRSRLKLAYDIPESKLSPYIAIELFTLGDRWKKTRHYLACTRDITNYMQLEWYYLYYTFNGLPPEHILGLGLNFEL